MRHQKSVSWLLKRQVESSTHGNTTPIIAIVGASIACDNVNTEWVANIGRRLLGCMSSWLTQISADAR